MGASVSAGALSQGAMEVMAVLEDMLAEITGMDAVTLQPAAGAHGEMTGILLIRALLESRGNPRKKLSDSRFGAWHQSGDGEPWPDMPSRTSSRTSAALVDLAELENARERRRRGPDDYQPEHLGVFEENITKIADILHAKGALVYMDGANMNALVGMARPGDFGVDVMHLNLHKTFSTPHGGGGPGAGPVAVKKHSGAVPANSAAKALVRRSLDVGLRPAAIDRPCPRVLRQLRCARARARVHPGARRRRPAQGDAGRGAERELHSQTARTLLRSALQRPACTNAYSAIRGRRSKACARATSPSG